MHDDKGRPLAENKVMIGREGPSKMVLYDYYRGVYLNYSEWLRKKSKNELLRVFWYSSFYDEETGE